MKELSILQNEICNILEQWSEKALITEAALAKKIRENLKIESKNKAGLSFRDIEDAILHLGEAKSIFFSLHVNSANDLLIKKSESAKPLDDDARKRRQSSEKAMSILTAGDCTKSKNTKSKKSAKLRTKRESINIYSDFEDI